VGTPVLLVPTTRYSAKAGLNNEADQQVNNVDVHSLPESPMNASQKTPSGRHTTEVS
jgi:hypothetical protein